MKVPKPRQKHNHLFESALLMKVNSFQSRCTEQEKNEGVCLRFLELQALELINDPDNEFNKDNTPRLK